MRRLRRNRAGHEKRGFAVGRRRLVDETHELVGRMSESEPGWFAVSDLACWRRSPARPLVKTDVRHLELHLGRREHRSPDRLSAPAVPVFTAEEAVAS
jgi:hypothetical protein